MAESYDGIMYKIQKKGGSADFYIGTTTRQLNVIFWQHKHAFLHNWNVEFPSFIILKKYGNKHCEIVFMNSCKCDVLD